MAANLNPNLETSRTQGGRILAHLLTGEALTALEALDRFGCSRLAARIGDIKAMGYSVHAKMVTLDSGKRVSVYSLGGTPVHRTAEVDREVVEPRQAGLGLEVELDGPSWLSRARWEL